MKRSPMPRRQKPVARQSELNKGNGLGRTSRIKARSRKTAAKYVQRRVLVAEMFAEPTVCEVPWCTSTATDPHEPKTRTRGGSILNRANVRLICNPCHMVIHGTEPAWAYELNFLVHSWEDVR
jgi:hypothetical protein